MSDYLLVFFVFLPFVWMAYYLGRRTMKKELYKEYERMRIERGVDSLAIDVLINRLSR